MVPKINNPCPEKWNGMTPVEGGCFCGKCAKVVYDFTKNSTQEIIDFLAARKEEDICGRLPKRVMVPVSDCQPSAPRRLTLGSRYQLKVFVAALVLVFGSMLFTSCGSEPEEEPVGKVGIDSATQAQQEQQRLYNDSVANANETTTHDNSDTGLIVIDTANMLSTKNILDSIMEAKKHK